MAAFLAALPGLVKGAFTLKNLITVLLGGYVAGQATDLGLKGLGNLTDTDLSLDKTIFGTELTDKEKKQQTEEIQEAMKFQSRTDARKQRTTQLLDRGGFFDDDSVLPNQLEVAEVQQLINDLSPLILASGRPLSSFVEKTEDDSSFLRAILTTKERRTVNDARIEAAFGPEESSEQILAKQAGLPGGFPEGN